jgi:hypothetical protein
MTGANTNPLITKNKSTPLPKKFRVFDSGIKKKA